MIDTIKIRIDSHNLPIDYESYLLQIITLTKIEQIVREEFITKIGKLKNMDIRLDKYGLQIEGSLTVYLLGNNLSSLNNNEAKKGIDSLGKDLGIDLNFGTVTRLDLAGNLITKYPVKEYLELMISGKRLDKHPYPFGVYFRNTVRCICVYDKIKQLEKKKIKFDPIFNDKNVLRFEYRYGSQSLSSFLKVKKATISDVLNNYNKLVRSWEEIFYIIDKKGEALTFSEDTCKVKSGIDKQISAKGIEAIGGLEEFLKIIKNLKSRGWLKKHPNEVSYLTLKYRALMKNVNLFQKSDLILELEQKMSLVSFHSIDRSDFYSTFQGYLDEEKNTI